MITIVAFIVAIGLLVAIHEYGHFQVARWCGVKVLRFAIGFGKPLLRWKSKNSDTEFVLCVLPLGGYVKMLDEREGEVDPAERHLAFNTQPVWKRFCIVAAGPIFNLLLAWGIYSAVAWVGVQQAQPIVATPPAESLAAKAGLRAGDKVMQWRYASDEQWQEVKSLEQLTWNLNHAALDKRDVALVVSSTLSADGGAVATATERTIVVPLHEMKPGQEAEEGLINIIGIGMPWVEPVIGAVTAGGAAATAGVQPNDVVVSINDQSVQDVWQLLQFIQKDLSGKPQEWKVRRSGEVLSLQVLPTIEQKGDNKQAKVGIELGAKPAMLTVKYGGLDGLVRGAERTWEISLISVKGFGKMLTGQISIKNLSGPITIANFAGRSAHAGFSAYLAFLGLISVSLGVLNLLPVPVLDGGHLMYYAWEAVRGKPVPEVWQTRLQKIGILLLGAMMLTATFNDIVRQLKSYF